MFSTLTKVDTGIFYFFGVHLFHPFTAAFSDINLQRSVVKTIHLKEAGIYCIGSGSKGVCGVASGQWVHIFYTSFIYFNYFMYRMIHKELNNLENPDQIRQKFSRPLIRNYRATNCKWMIEKVRQLQDQL